LGVPVVCTVLPAGHVLHISACAVATVIDEGMHILGAGGIVGGVLCSTTLMFFGAWMFVCIFFIYINYIFYLQ
jgi:hypothetical protein